MLLQFGLSDNEDEVRDRNLLDCSVLQKRVDKGREDANLTSKP